MFQRNTLCRNTKCSLCSPLAKGYVPQCRISCGCVKTQLQMKLQEPSHQWQHRDHVILQERQDKTADGAVGCLSK